MSDQLEQATSVVAEKEKISLRITLPKSGVVATELSNLCRAIGEATESYEVVVSISTSSS